MKPARRPGNPNFSSGPCRKRSGWTLSCLSNTLDGRSHRSAPGKAKLAEVIDRTRSVLNIPRDYRIGIVPASDTGAVEMAMWSLLGARGVDVLVWESFGAGWALDINGQLRLADVRVMKSDYGDLPDLTAVDSDRDIVFTWNGTTSGVCVPNGDWIAADRAGLTICDATSAAFAMDLPWDKLDVTTFSWQKVLGGEAAHGTLILSPRAVARLESHTPSWPIPKIFRLTKGGKLIEGIFRGETINTPSMLCVEDVIDALKWSESIGGLAALIGRAQANLSVVERWVSRGDWADFLSNHAMSRSCTSICLKITDSWFTGLPQDQRKGVLKQITAALDSEGVAHDIGSYREAPPGFRLWGGATVECSDLEALLPWLDWAFTQVKTGRSLD